MDDFRLKVFVAVARNGSFTKAATELFISQPAVSKHIHELESSYQVRLFERNGNLNRLTPAGELLLSHADTILHQYKQLAFEMNLVTQNHVGELRIGASTTIAQYLLPAPLSLFIRKFPNIKVTLFTANSNDIERALTHGSIDIGLVEGCRRQSSLHYTPFLRDELVVVTNTRGLYSSYSEISLEQLQQFPLVIRENGSGSLDVIEKSLSAHNLKLSAFNVLLQLGSTEGIKRFLETSDAVGIISIAALSEELISGRLKVVEITDLSCERDFMFVRNQGDNSPLTLNFERFIASRL